MPEVRYRNVRVVVTIEEPDYLGQYDDLRSEAMMRAAVSIKDRLEELGIESEILRDPIVVCEWCGKEMTPEASAWCCDLARREQLDVAIADASEGLTPADVVRSVLAKLSGPKPRDGRE